MVLSSSNTNNYENINITLQDIDNDTPLVVNSGHTVRNVFGGLNKIIKAIIDEFAGITHRKSGKENNVIATTMRGKTYNWSGDTTVTDNYNVVIDGLSGDYRTILFKLTYGDSMVSGYWHPFLPDGTPMYITASKNITMVHENLNSGGYDYIQAIIGINSISYQEGAFTIKVETKARRGYKYISGSHSLTVPSTGATLEWEAF